MAWYCCVCGSTSGEPQKEDRVLCPSCNRPTSLKRLQRDSKKREYGAYKYRTKIAQMKPIEESVEAHSTTSAESEK